MKKKMKIAFVGGGTLGPVTPLLAVMRSIRLTQPGAEFIWFGTPNGPERVLVPKDVPFFAIPVAKFPRHPSIELLKFPFMFLYGTYKARKFIRKEAPDIVVGAGGFTQVPVINAAHEYGIPSVIHQLDHEPGLSNQSIALKTVSVTTSFAYEREPFSAPVKSHQIATPVRFLSSDLVSKKKAANMFGLDAAKPITLIMGGGTGALSINETVAGMLDDLLRTTQVIHVTGKGKKVSESREGYAVREFLTDDLIAAYSATDLVVSRAGMGAISECAALGLAMILVPIAKSQQEANAEYMESAGGAVVIHQDRAFAETLKKEIRNLVENASERKRLAKAAQNALPTDGGDALADVVLKHL